MVDHLISNFLKVEVPRVVLEI